MFKNRTKIMEKLFDKIASVLKKNTFDKDLQDFSYDFDLFAKLILSEEKNYDTYFEEFCNGIAKTEYGTKAVCVPRGFYCPSKIIDIISNNKRGKLVKRGKYDYIYNFDENGQLIFVRRSNAKACEYIKHQGNIEIGLTFRRRNKIEAVTLCEFYDDGKIKRYVYYYCESNGFAQLEEEFYNYNGDFTEVISARFVPVGTNFYIKDTIFSKARYLFYKTQNNKFQYDGQDFYPILRDKITYYPKGEYPF